MILRIKPLVGEEKIIEIEPTDQIITVKEKLQGVDGTAADQQRLIYKGKFLKNEKTIENYHLKNGATLQMVKALRNSIYTTWLILRYQHLALSKDLTSLLKSLKKKFQIALISNGTSAAQWEKIEKLNLKDCFDVILVSGDLLCEKPDKDIFLNACKQLDVHPKSCLMVGDKLETDILGGIEAGLAGTVWIPLNSHYNLNETDPKPQYILKDIMELRYLLTNIDEFHKKMAYKHKKRGSISTSASQFNYNDEDASSSSSFLEHSSSKKINMKFLQFSRLHLEEDSNNSNASDGS